MVSIPLFRENYRQITEKAMAPHSSTLAWKIPWMEEPGRAAVHGVAKSRTQLSDFTFTFHFHTLEKKMATHSSVLAWRIPGMGETGGLPSMGLHRVRHNWSDLAVAAAITFKVVSDLELWNVRDDADPAGNLLGKFVFSSCWTWLPVQLWILISLSCFLLPVDGARFKCWGSFSAPGWGMYLVIHSAPSPSLSF